MGYGYSSRTAAPGFEALGVIFWLVLVCYILAWVVSMGIVTKAAKEKGYGDLGAKLWFIGLFGVIFTPAIIVAALPDKVGRSVTAQGAQSSSATKDVDDELPEL